MNLGQRIVASAVRELGQVAARQGSLDEAQQLLSALPWSGDLSVDFVGELLDTAVHQAPVLSPAAVVARAELVLALVRDRELGLQRAAVSGALRVAAAANDPQRTLAYARLGLSDQLVRDAPRGYAAECYEALGRGYAVLGDQPQADENFSNAAREAAAVGASAVEARALAELAAGRLASDDPLAAVELAEAAAQRADDSDHAGLSRAYGLLGTAWLRLRDLAAAERALRRALAAAEQAADRKGCSDWLGNLGNVAVQAGHFDEAVRFHRQALTLSQEIADHDGELVDRENLAATLVRAGRADEAVEQLIEALHVAEEWADPEAASEVRRHLLRAYVDAGRYAEAVALKDLLDPPQEPDLAPQEGAAAEGDDTDPDATEFLTKLRQLRRDELESARELVDEFARHHPHSYAAEMGRGMLLRAQGRPGKAAAEYARALQLAPNRIELHNNLLAAVGAAGKIEKQAKRYHALVRDDPTNPVLRFALGCTYLMRGQPDPAMREFRESLRLGEPSGLALNWLCAALVAKGKAVIAGGPPLDLERWSAAWGYFEECRTIAQRVHGSRVFREVEALVMVSDLLVEIAFCSLDANPPLVGSIGDREFETLTEAGALLVRAARGDSEANVADARFNRLAALMQGFGEQALSDFLQAVAIGVAE